MRTACWIPTAADTHSEYVIFIAFLLPLWTHESAAMLRHTYVLRLSSLLWFSMTSRIGKRKRVGHTDAVSN